MLKAVYFQMFLNSNHMLFVHYNRKVVTERILVTCIGIIKEFVCMPLGGFKP